MILVRNTSVTFHKKIRIKFLEGDQEVQEN